MSIFSNEHLTEQVDAMDMATAKAVLRKIINIKMSEETKGRVARAILGIDQSVKEKKIVKLAKDRTIPYSTMEKLAESPMIDYVEELVRAALDPRGPYQSREIMMLAAQIKGPGEHPFITAHGIPQAMKNQAGHILTMAGFERQSHYDKERRMPVKAWKSKHGWAKMTVEERVNEVRATLQTELSQTEPAPKVQTFSLLGSYL
jgi:hypothetical protein